MSQTHGNQTNDWCDPKDNAVSLQHVFQKSLLFLHNFKSIHAIDIVPLLNRHILYAF